jgi:aspartate carbamoyltransferase catalytic subunit
MKSLLATRHLSREGVDRILAQAKAFSEEAPVSAPSRLIGLAFFESSLRTRLGFHAASHRLGCATVEITGLRYGPTMSSPETLEDSLRAVDGYCDVVCLRHPDNDVIPRLAQLISTPIVNCGNGTDDHPTQALIDLYAITRLRGQVDGVRIAMIGDLLHMRAAHALMVVLARFEDVYVRLVSPPQLQMPEAYLPSSRGMRLAAQDDVDVSDVDIVYMAGFAAKTPAGYFDEQIRHRYRVDGSVLCSLPSGSAVLCPLPRVDEIAPEVDELASARYFDQSVWALFVRMAVLSEVLNF